MLRKAQGVKGERMANFEWWVKFGQPKNRKGDDVALGDKLEQKLRGGRFFYLGTVDFASKTPWFSHVGEKPRSIRHIAENFSRNWAFMQQTWAFVPAETARQLTVARIWCNDVGLHRGLAFWGSCMMGSDMSGLSSSGLSRKNMIFW